jgi:hypothetical protein
MRLGILPEGYIYPKEDRPIRDLLRKRGYLVKLRQNQSLVNTMHRFVSCVSRRGAPDQVEGGLRARRKAGVHLFETGPHYFLHSWAIFCYIYMYAYA